MVDSKYRVNNSISAPLNRVHNLQRKLNRERRREQHELTAKEAFGSLVDAINSRTIL